jgi:putative transposase
VQKSRFSEEQIIGVLREAEAGRKIAVVVDNGPELPGRALDQRAFERGVQLHFIDPGKSVQSWFVESFNGRFRDECLEPNWITSLSDAIEKIEGWRVDYNRRRPHGSLEKTNPGGGRQLPKETK